MKTENLLSLSAVVIAFLFGVCSCSQSSSANMQALKATDMAQTANTISQQALDETKKSNEISKEANIITLNSASLGNAKDAYNEIEDWWTNKALMQTLKKRDTQVVDIQELTSFVDIFEGIGWQYCAGNITAFDIRLYFWRSLENVCRHHQIISIFWGHKNWLSILCSRFTKESGFSAFLRNESANGCNFK